MNYLKISYQIRTNEAIVEAFKLVANVVVSSFAHNVLEASHHMIDETLVNSLVHGRLSLFSALHIQNPYKRLDGDALKEHGEINHAYCRRHKQRLEWDVFRVNQQHESERDCPSEAAVRHNELIDFR